MDNLENLAVLLGLLNIILVVRRSLWNYPFGIAMVSLYFFIFAAEKLYSDALLQIFFLVVQLYGWWCWIKGRDNGRRTDRRAPLRPGAVAVGRGDCRRHRALGLADASLHRCRLPHGGTLRSP